MIRIHHDTWRLLMHAVTQMSPLEVSGWAKMKISDGGIFEVAGPLWIPPQEVTRDRATVQGEDHELAQDRAKVLAPEDGELIACQWHSHGHGKAFFSSVDDEDQSRVVDEMGQFLDVILFLVMNTSGEVEAKLWSRQSFGSWWTLTQPVEVAWGDVDLDLSHVREKKFEPKFKSKSKVVTGGFTPATNAEGDWAQWLASFDEEE